MGVFRLFWKIPPTVGGGIERGVVVRRHHKPGQRTRGGRSSQRASLVTGTLTVLIRLGPDIGQRCRRCRMIETVVFPPQAKVQRQIAVSP